MLNRKLMPLTKKNCPHHKTAVKSLTGNKSYHFKTIKTTDFNTACAAT